MRRRKTIALLSNDAGLGDHYQGLLRRGVEHACSEEGVDLWCYGARMDMGVSSVAQQRLLELVDPRSIDGVVLAAACIAAYAPIELVVQRLRAHSVPTCAVGQTCDGVFALTVDNAGGTARLVEHFVEEHQRRAFLFIAGPAGHQESEERLSGARTALARYALTLPDSRVRHGHFSADSGRKAIREAVSAGLSFDCVVAANDEMAVGAIDELAGLGIRCPEDVTIGGFDDAACARFHEPAITTVRQPVALLGAAAVARLVDVWSGRGAPAVEAIETELVIRESCGCRPVFNPRSLPPKANLRPINRSVGIETLLTPVIDSRARREHWASELRRAMAAERLGNRGALVAVIKRLLASLTHPNLLIDELQPVLTILRRVELESGPHDALEEAFHAARVLIGNHASRHSGDREIRNNWLMRELQVSSEKLATSLSLPVLKATLTSQLPELGIQNALVSLYSAENPDELECLVCIEGGVAVESPPVYPAVLVIPPGALELPRPACFTVLPLTFETDQIGVVVLALPVGLPLFALLREQIGSAIKTMQLHQEVLDQLKLNAEVQEEKRATAERLRSLNLVAGGVAHDLNNVLGPLVALPELIQRELEGCAPAEVLEDLATIHEAGERAAHTIRDLLTLGRMHEIPREPVDLNRLMEQERRAFQALCESEPQISLRVSECPRPVIVRASPPHIVRAISNLVLNAVDAIDGPGTISIRVLTRTLTRRLEGVEPVEPGDYGVIEVEDTGAGIPPQHLERVLEPFFSAKRRPGMMGTGLGLAIVHRIVKESLGALHVESTLGRGTTFSLYFPRQFGVEQVRPVEPPGVRGGDERILVIDDEVVQLRTARRILGQLGYTVSTAQSGREAIELVSREVRPFDLLIVDMLMPGQNGLTTIEEARKLRPSLNVLVASGYAPEEMDALAKARGLSFIPKPYTRAALAMAIRGVLDTRAPAPTAAGGGGAPGSRST